MKITASTKISEILAAHPDMLDELVKLSPDFSMLKNPIARATMAKVASLEKAASMVNMDTDLLISKICSILREKGIEVETDGAYSSQERVETLKQLIKELHAGASVDDVKKRFSELVKDANAPEIAEMEQQLIREGLPVEEVQRLCDVHVEVFKDALEERERPVVPPGHPVHSYMQENTHAAKLLDELEKSFESDDWGKVSALVDELSKIDIHYTRKENQLFPAIERHNVSGPSQVMWAIHDDIRAGIKELKRLAEKQDKSRFSVMLREVATAIREMIYKEEHILFPLALDVLDDSQWARIREGEDEIGFAWIEKPPAYEAKTKEEKSQDALSGTKSAFARDGFISESELAPVLFSSLLFPFSTGKLSAEQADLILKHLPVDVSFVDENDEVKYYTDTPHRIFPRSPEVIGRNVRNCHPTKSVHIVEKILSSFKEGKKDTAEFWIELGGRFIHIRYFAVRDKEGRYRGCLEVSQDITEIRKLSGQKRLLDWED